MTDYCIADLDVTGFTTDWLLTLDRDDAPARSLLDYVGEGYDYGAHFMMANIGPRATEPVASDEELILYAALAAFQNDEFPGRAQWEGATNHLVAVFSHANHLGRTGVALNLLQSLAERGRRDPSAFLRQLRTRAQEDDPAKLAEHDRDMAQILSRDVRAAQLLDPTISIDDLLLS